MRDGSIECVSCFVSVGVGLVAEDLFAAALGDEVGFAGQAGDGLAEILPEEDAADAGPFEASETLSSKMGGASGKKLPYQRLELRPLRMWMGWALWPGRWR